MIFHKTHWLLLNTKSAIGLSLLWPPLLFFLIRYLPVENNLYSVYTGILLLGNLFQGLYMLFQTTCTAASTLTSNINDMNTVAPCWETLSFFSSWQVCDKSSHRFLSCWQFAIVAKVFFVLFLVLKYDFFLVFVLFVCLFKCYLMCSLTSVVFLGHSQSNTLISIVFPSRSQKSYGWNEKRPWEFTI